MTNEVSIINNPYVVLSNPPQVPSHTVQVGSQPGQITYQPVLGQYQQSDFDFYLSFLRCYTNRANAIKDFFNAMKAQNKLATERQFQANVQQASSQLLQCAISPLENSPEMSKSRFDFTLLPADLQEDVECVSQATGWDKFAALLGILGSVSAALWGRYEVRVGDWTEPVATYLNIASPSGTRKSAFVKLLKEPMIAFRDAWNERLDRDGLGDQETVEDVYSAMRKKRRKDIGNLMDACGDDVEAFLKAYEEKKAKKAAYKSRLDEMNGERATIFLDNGTPKKLIQVMRANGEAGCIFEPEIGFLEDVVADKKLALRLLLKSNGMEELADVTCRNEVVLSRPALNVIYVVQPEALAKMYADRRVIAVGLTPRFDIYFARSTPSLTRLDEAKWARYRDRIIGRFWHNYTQERPRPISTLAVSEEAQEGLTRLMTDVSVGYSGPAFNHMAEYIKKHHGKALRWAALIHCYEHERPEEYPISAASMWAGIHIAGVLFSHAYYAFSSDGLRGYAIGQQVIAYLKCCGNDTVASREIQRELGAHLKLADIVPVLFRLQQHNIIKLCLSPKGGFVCVPHPFIQSI